MKVSRQDERTAWDPSHSSVTARAVTSTKKFPGRRLDNLVLPFAFRLLLPLFFAAQKNDRGRAESLVMAQAWGVTSWIAYPVFALLPADIDLRWQLGEMEGIYGFVYSAFHKLDEPFNAWPCLHIAQSFVMAAPFGHAGGFNANGLGRSGSLAGLAWPLISVMTTKQHFIWDSILARCWA
ncbi:MAG: hypothetical protein Ct9H300mP7_1380 [Verrucomicrobiota bacterium]|nr:MAG: hypothetical protein Ct9H300mP7_1380 [Verrucomicrobiota bacterium]